MTFGGAQTGRMALVATALMLLALPGSAEGLSSRGLSNSLPGATDPNAAAPRLTVQSPRRSPVPRAADELVFEVKDIVISGATVYDAATLRSLGAPLLGHKARLSDLLDLAEKIEARYHDDGYLLTRALVPTQSVSDGTFQITVQEGYIAALVIDGKDEGLRERIEAILAKVLASRPLQLSVLESALLRANEIPGAHVAGLLRPSETEVKASELVINVDAPTTAASLTIDNRGSENTGVWTIGANLAVRTGLKDGGQIILGAAATPDAQKRRVIQGKYIAEVGPSGAVVSLGAMASHGEPAGTIKALDIVSNSTSFGPRLSYPIYVDRSQRLGLETGITFQSADLQTLGAPLSHDNWRVGDIAITYLNKDVLKGSLDASVILSKGFTLVAATRKENPSQARANSDPAFTKLSGSVRRVQNLYGPVSVALTAQGQHGWSRLLTGEEISFGGGGIGRGYDPAALTGDDGYGLSSELRIDWDETGLFTDWMQAYLFQDTARAFSRDGGGHTWLNSAGLGLRTRMGPLASLGLELARTLTPLPGSDKGRRSTRVLVNGAVRY